MDQAVGSSLLINHPNIEWENEYSSAVQHLFCVQNGEGKCTVMAPTEITSEL